MHVLVAGALGMERQPDAAVLAVALAIALARVEERLGTLGVEGDQTQAMGDELVGQHGAVVLDFYQVDRDGRDLGEHDAAQRVCERDVGVGKLELCAYRVCLFRAALETRSLHQTGVGRQR